MRVHRVLGHLEQRLLLGAIVADAQAGERIPEQGKEAVGVLWRRRALSGDGERCDGELGGAARGAREMRRE